jgi:membrane associated rhomboid family serine protease
VTKVLIALNVGVFLWATADAGSSVGGTVGRGSVERDLALSARFVEDGDWWRLFTSGFVHYGLLHLAFNMLLLWQFGSMLEPALGRIRFAALYVTALLCGSFGAVLLSPSALTAGASGAVFGLVGAAAIGLRRRGIGVWDSGVGGLLVVNLVLTFAVPNISIGGHVGGLLGGGIVGATMLDVRPARLGLVVAVVVSLLAVVGGMWAAGRP